VLSPKKKKEINGGEVCCFRPSAQTPMLGLPVSCPSLS
jgi:hypothetical protein